MESHTQTLLHRQLEERRTRLRGFVVGDRPEPHLVRLLQQVDAALDRFHGDEVARCLVCRECVGEDELLINPLLEYCLCALTPEQQRALESDLGLARRIQTALLPDPEMTAAGWDASYHYEPAGVVSGDYCDLWTPPGRGQPLYFAVGDVSGKGVAASLLMTHLQASVRSLAGAGVPLIELVDRVDHQLRQAAIPTHYATLAVGCVSGDGDVEIVNAGHCPPLAVHHGTVTAVEAGGLPVGLLPGPSRDATRLHLGAGDALVLYTDGLTEAARPDGEEYGVERVERLFLERMDGKPPRELVRAVRGDLETFLEPALPSDDLTVLVLRRSQAA